MLQQCLYNRFCICDWMSKYALNILNILKIYVIRILTEKGQIKGISNVIQFGSSTNDEKSLFFSFSSVWVLLFGDKT